MKAFRRIPRVCTCGVPTRLTWCALTFTDKLYVLKAPGRLRVFCLKMPELNLRNLKIELKTVTDWHSLGIQLEVPDYELRKIDQDYHGSDRKMSAMLNYWLNNCSEHKLLWQTIADALKHIGYNNLAKELEGKMGGHVCPVGHRCRSTHAAADDNNSGLFHRRQEHGPNTVSDLPAETIPSMSVKASTCTLNKPCLCLVLGAAILISSVAGVVWLFNNGAEHNNNLDKKPRMDELYLLRLPDEKTVNIIESVAVSYQEFGCHLLDDIEGTIVETIYMNNKNNVKRATENIFRNWLAGKGKRPVTWRTLIKVLEDMKEHEAARKIKTALTVHI